MKALLLVLIACGRPPLPPTDSGELRALAPTAHLVWIGAHPDDETILAGALWSSVCRSGASCDFVLGSDGRTGSCGSVAMSDGECPCSPFVRTCPERMGETRVREVGNAAAIFGAQLQVLAFDTWPEAEQVAALQQTVADAVAAHATVIVTHAPTGGYGHYMHERVGQAVLDTWRALPREQQPLLAFALDLDPDSVDQAPVTDTISGDAPCSGVELSGAACTGRVWARVRTALHAFVTQVASESSLAKAHATERSSFRLLHPGE